MPHFVMGAKGGAFVLYFYELPLLHGEDPRLLPVSVNDTGDLAQYAPAAAGGLRLRGPRVAERRGGRSRTCARSFIRTSSYG